MFCYYWKLFINPCYVIYQIVPSEVETSLEIPLRSELIDYARCWVDALEDVVSDSQLYSVHFVQQDFTSVITHCVPLINWIEPHSRT